MTSPFSLVARFALGGALAIAACGSDNKTMQMSGTGGSSGGATGLGGITSMGGASGGPGGNGFPAGPLDLCAGLIQDKAAHPMTTVAQPPLGGTATDAEFGTSFRRITQAPSSGQAAIIPMYSTVSAWNADESRLILYNTTNGGQHELYDGKTYAHIRTLSDLHPPDLEQIYWHTTDPDVLFLVEQKKFTRYHIASAQKEVLTTFDFCAGGAGGGSDPMFSSFDSNRFGLNCDGSQVFIYEVSSNSVLGRISSSENPGQVAPSGRLAYMSDSGNVTDANLVVQRKLDLKEPYGHASMSRLPTGEDTWNGQVFDAGPMGDDDIGNLVVFNLLTGTSKTVIGPKTGYPYPPDSHISAMAYRQPGWIVVSTFGNHSGAGLLDMEILVADTVSNKVCRVGRHRAWGKSNTMAPEPYWAEPHAVPSPSGTRIAFASDWGNGATIDTYVLELPSYHP